MATLDPDSPDVAARIGRAMDSPFSADDDAQSLSTWAWLAELARRVSENPDAMEPGCALSPPRVVGRFRLEAWLGSGSYGAVFRALDLVLERWVALKLAWPVVMFDPVASQRFVDEAKTVAALSHPGIVQVHDSDWIGSVCFISLELIHGPSLGQWTQGQGPVSVRRAAAIMLEVAEAIHFAHAQGFVHRDLKPGNILLRCPSAAGESSLMPVVCDFGLARRPRLAGATTLTRTREILGTDPYIAPEQLSEDGAEAGPASDVFSLGVILYELVAGRRPFDGGSFEATRKLIQEEDPPSIRSWRTGVPHDLETIILKCLQKAPGERYSSAQELADDLARFLDGKPIRARRTSWPQRGWKYAKRKPLVVSLVGLALTSAVVTVGLITAMVVGRIAADRQIAVAEATAATSAGLERQHQYASDIQHAAEALRRGNRRDVMDLLEKCRALAHPPVVRGLEWDLLWAQVNGAERSWQAHAGGVRCLRFSAQGNLLVSGGSDGKVIAWDAATWTKHWEVNDKVGEVSVVEPSADGTLVAVGGDDGRVVVHRLADGQVMFDRPVVAGRVFAMCWIETGRQVAVGGDSEILSIVDVDRNEIRNSTPLPVLPDYRGAHAATKEICGLCNLPASNAIAVATVPASIHLVDPASLKVLASWSTPKGNTELLYLDKGPGYLATGSGTSLRILSVDDGSELFEIPLRNTLQSLGRASDSGTLVVGLRNGSVQAFDVKKILAEQDAEVRNFCAHDGRTLASRVAPGDRWVATGGKDGYLRTWLDGASLESVDQTVDFKPTAVVFSPCGRWLLLGGESANKMARLEAYSTATGQRKWFETRPYDLCWWLWQQPSPVTPIAPDGNEVALVIANSIMRYDLRTGQHLSAWPTPSERPLARLSYSSDGRTLVATISLGDCVVIDRYSGEILERSSDSKVASLGMFRTNRGDLHVEMSARRRQCVLRRSLSAPPLLTLSGPTEKFWVAAVSRDGRYLAVASDDMIFYVWDLDHPGTPSKFIGHEAAIAKLCFSPDGQTLVSHAGDGTVRLWHLPTRAELVKLGSAAEPVLAMDLHPDGDLLVLAVERRGEHGLQIHRLGPRRDVLPRQFGAAAGEAR